MAGGGTRFSQKGYAIPKPLLPVMGKPMCVQAALSLPPATEHCFIVQKEHEEKFHLREKIRAFIPAATIVEIDGITEGQAATCLLAKEHINNEKELLIGACDNGIIYNQQAFSDITTDADVVIFTFRNNKAVLAKPEAYGWVKANSEAAVTAVSVKVPISNDPLNDPAVVGAFWFRKGSYFVDAAEKMIAENRRVNGEFYVDECLNDCIHIGLRVKAMDIESYLGWGTPPDYESFCYWEGFFNKYLPA